MVKISSFAKTCDEMHKHKADPDTQNPRKRKRKHKNAAAIDKLPDDILIAILSRMSFKDAVRTSLLSSRWRYLWMFTSGTLEFDDRDTATGTKMKRKKFKAWVNGVLKLHQCRGVDSLVIRFTNLRLRARSSDINSWIYFAIQKEVKRFELNLSVPDGFHCNYEFPSIEKLLSPSHEVKVKSAFGSLRSLRLVDVDIKDEVVQYFLASCPCIEQLFIKASNAMKNLEVVDPLANLKELEISDCCNLHSMEITAMNLVSCTYQGSNINSPFKKTPNLSELTLGGLFCKSFIFEPNKHSSYSAQLVKLVLNLKTVSHEETIASPDLPQLYSLKRLELNTVTELDRSLLFFTSLIKASPKLQEFKIKIEYFINKWPRDTPRGQMPYPYVMPAMAGGFHHNNLKVVEMAGFVGFQSEEEFLLELFKVAPSVEMVYVDTESDFYRIHPLVKIVTENEGKKPPWIDPFLRETARYWWDRW